MKFWGSYIYIHSVRASVGKFLKFSSQPQAEAQQEKRRKLIRVGDPDSEEDAPLRGSKPDWTSGSLLEQPEEWRTDFFHDQMNRLQQHKEAFICE
ncbi:hypothetical protein Hanom_Chr10g00898451 [Helianthus anomalus]